MRYLDCTLRDGGYYNEWDFPQEIVDRYLKAMSDCGVEVVELGLRTLKNEGFKGASAFTTDTWLQSLSIPDNLQVGVMINASELLGSDGVLEDRLRLLFPHGADSSVVTVVRIACHLHEFEAALPASRWLKQNGFEVGFNLMQIADRSRGEVEKLSEAAACYPLDVLYFADSMGGMTPDDTSRIIKWLRKGWKGPLGIHTHDNMGLALNNSLRAQEEGVTWIDSTVTGMGRGPGNARTEEVVITMMHQDASADLVTLLELIEDYFKPLQHQCGWGSNPFYYLTGKYGIHPSFVQEMQADSRYSVSDILSVIEKLKDEGGKKYSRNALDLAKQVYSQNTGHDETAEIGDLFSGRKVLLVGTGPSSRKYARELADFARQQECVVVALNTDQHLEEASIDYRIVCHPVRMLADREIYSDLPQPIIAPYSLLPNSVSDRLNRSRVVNVPLSIESGTFNVTSNKVVCPTSLVAAYALAVSSAGQAEGVFLAGFDGYASGDPRNKEMSQVLEYFEASKIALPVVSITPTSYDIEKRSLYGRF